METSATKSDLALIDAYLKDVRGYLVGNEREAERALQELREHLNDAAVAGELRESLDRLGSAEAAAASFARSEAMVSASLSVRFCAAAIDNLPLIALTAALLVQDILRGADRISATFPPYVYVDLGRFAAAPFPFTAIGAYGGGLIYALGMPLALFWSIIVLGILESRGGAGPGKRLMNLRVVTKEGIRAHPHACMLRRISFLAGPFAWADWIPALWGDRQRALDRVFDTRVISLEQRVSGKRETVPG